MYYVSIFYLPQLMRCSVVNPFTPTSNDRIRVLLLLKIFKF
jgi:hypothetical protein